MFETIEKFYVKMREMKIDRTDMIADAMELPTTEEEIAHKKFINGIYNVKREYKQDMEMIRNKQ